MEGQQHVEEMSKPSNDSEKRKADNMNGHHVPTDVTFLLGTTAFKSRKAVLAESSAVFKAMFFGPWADLRKDVVNINDMDTTGFRNLLTFVSTGKVVLKGIKDTLATAYAADRYMVPTLYNICVQRVKSAISVANIWTVYEAAILLQNNLIRKVCKNFMVMHADTLLKSVQFLQCSTIVLTCLVNDLAFEMLPENFLPALVAWTRRRKSCINFVLKSFKSYLDSIDMKPVVFRTYVDSYKSRVLTDKEFEAISLQVLLKCYRKELERRQSELRS